MKVPERSIVYLVDLDTVVAEQDGKFQLVDAATIQVESFDLTRRPYRR